MPPNQEEQHQKENPKQPSPTRSESEQADEEITLEHPSGDMFNPNQASTSYKPPTTTFSFTPIFIEDEPLSSEQEDLFATKKDVSSLRSMINVIITGMDLSRMNK